MDDEVIGKLLAKIFKYLNLSKNSKGEWSKSEDMKESVEVKVKNLMTVDAEEKGKMALELMGQGDLYDETSELRNIADGEPEKRNSKLQFLQAPDIIKKQASMPAAMIQMQKDAKSIYGPSKAEAQSNIDSVKSKLLTGVSLKPAYEISLDEKSDQDRSIFDAFVSGSQEYRSEKRLKIKEALGPKKPED